MSKYAYEATIQEVNSAGKAAELPFTGRGSSRRVALQRAAAEWAAKHPHVQRTTFIVCFFGGRLK